MKAISLFSGVGGFDIGFERAGIETVLQVEKDEHCLSVLERHWPDVERMTDVRATRRTDEIEGVDLIYGGFPCQDISIAGSRAGLTGERSGLWFEFERIVSELRPRWVVIENVAGLLSSNGGADLGVILTGLDKLGFDASWAVLDAQHFGVPQHRRRVFIVGGPRGRRAEQVLSLCESCGGNPETCQMEGHYYPRASKDGTRNSGKDGPRREIAQALMARDAKGPRPEKSIGTAVSCSDGVRRLTPRECERLMAWPDDWTRWEADGTEISDTQRYRMCGNGVVATVSEWLGTRLMAVDQI